MFGRMFLTLTSVHRMTKSFRFLDNGASIAFRRWTRCQISPYSSITDKKKREVHNEDEDEINDKPITYSTSQAAEWSSRQTFGEVPKDKQPPALQPPAVIISLIVFLVYFCVLREENDIDAELTVPLHERVEGLEEVNLMQAINYRKDRGLDTTDLEARLEEVKSRK